MRAAGIALVFCLVLAGCQDKANPVAARGATIAEERGCVSCHTSDGSKGVGPTWKGLYLSQVELADSRMVIADEEYLRRSINDPSADTVKGFSPGTMERVIAPGSLSENEVSELIAYIKSLR